MFNSDYKKESLANLKVVANEYQIKYKSTINSVMDLHALRLKSVELIKSVESYIYSIENVPNELQTILKATNTNYTNFEIEIKNIEVFNTVRSKFIKCTKEVWEKEITSDDTGSSYYKNLKKLYFLDWFYASYVIQ